MTDFLDNSWLAEQIVSHSQVGVIFADRGGTIRLWNSGAETIFGYSAAEAVGCSMHIIIPEKHRARHDAGYESVMSTGVTKYGRDVLAVPAMRKDGKRISIEFNIAIVRSPAGEILGAAATVQDVTARWEKDKNLRARLALLEKEQENRKSLQVAHGAGAGSMNFERVNIDTGAGHTVPAFLLANNSPVGGALLLHGYGGGKEHMLGLAAPLAEAGWAVLSVDLCGHGQNTAPLGVGMAQEVETALRYLRRYGNTAAIGLSLGGRLALTCSADVAVAISPSVVSEISDRGRWMFENFPSPAVREPYPGYVVRLLEELGPIRTHTRPCLILYAERDIPAILEGASGLKSTFPQAQVRYITRELRPEVQHENGFIRYLPRWFNHIDLKFNSEVFECVAEWLAQPRSQAATQQARA